MNGGWPINRLVDTISQYWPVTHALETHIVREYMLSIMPRYENLFFFFFSAQMIASNRLTVCCEDTGWKNVVMNEMSSLSRKSCTNDIKHWPQIRVGCMCDFEGRVLRSVVSHGGSLITVSEQLYNTRCVSVRNPNPIYLYTDNIINGFIRKAESDRMYPVINSSWFVDDYQLPKWLSNKPIHSVHIAPGPATPCSSGFDFFSSFLSVLNSFISLPAQAPFEVNYQWWSAI